MNINVDEKYIYYSPVCKQLTQRKDRPRSLCSSDLGLCSGHCFFHSMSVGSELLLKESHSAVFAEKIWGWWGWNEH